MTPDLLKERLSEIPIPPAAQAREQAVAEARAEVAQRETGAAPPREWRPRLLSLAAALLLVIVLLLTPPGRAASAWVGDLVGIGDVGGPPTQEKRGGFADAGSAVVVDNGVAPDGTRYEWVAYKCSVGQGDEPGTKFKGIGASLDWPGVKEHEGGGSCEELQGMPRHRAFSQFGVHVLPSQMKAVVEPDLVISGVTGPDVHRVGVIYTDGDGEKHELPVDFARVEGKLRELASQPEPLGTFVAFLAGDTAARDEVPSRLDLRAQYGTGKLKLGPIGRRELEQARKAFEACPTTTQGPSPADECLAGRLPRGPFEYIAYDEKGQVLDRITEPLTAASVRPESTIQAEGREEPGDKRARRIPEAGRSASTILMTGRSPDGALFEAYVQQSGSVASISLFWPYAPLGGGGGGTGDGLPPSTAFGRRHPERVFAKPYGFLNDASEATTHRVISGFARTNVERVEVLYQDSDGAKRQAPVKLAQATASMLREFEEGSKPFGYWIAFVPRSAGHKPIEVIAYGGGGDRLSTFKLQNP